MTTDFSIPDNRLWQKTYAKHNLAIEIELPTKDQSLIDMLENNFAKYPNRPAFTCMGTTISYQELDEFSQRFAAYLQSLGLKRGDKVAAMMPNILQYPVVIIGIIRAGLTLVNVNPMYTAHELLHQINDAEAKALVILENFAHTFAKIAEQSQVRHVIVTAMGDMMGAIKGFVVNTVVRHVKKLVPDWDLPSSIDFKYILSNTKASQYKRPTNILADDIAVLQYTGGTTGVAKGAMLTHSNLLSNVRQCTVFIGKRFAPTEDLTGKYIVVALPMYHIFSFTACVLLGMERGFAQLLIPDPRDLKSLIKEYDRYQPVFFPAVNTLFNALAHHKDFTKLDHRNLRLSLGGGMSVLSNTAELWRKVTGDSIIEGYGLSETSPVLVLNPPGEYSGKIGVPMPSTDVLLLDDKGNEVPFGEPGEICAKGPQVMKGYWKRPEATNESMINGYFRTGDIGVIDENGYIKIVDRKKDMILVSGFNVYPNEVEDAMTKHPKILECGVIGIPDERSGETPKIFIVKKDPSLTVEEVKAFAKECLTGYKRPRHIEFVTELPKSNVGKILRKDLRELEKQKPKSHT